MASKKTPPTKSEDSPLKARLAKRMAQADFKNSLKEALARQIRELGAQPIEDVVDWKSLRRMVEEFDRHLIPIDIWAELIYEQLDVLEDYLARKKITIGKLLDKKALKSFDEIWEQQIVLSENGREMVDKIMRAEFISEMFADVIHVAIVNFYKKINPVFGGLATTVLEKQIKAFIQLCLQMVLDRATAFAVSPSNMALVSGFVRKIARLILDEPLINFLENVPKARRELIKEAVKDFSRSTPLDKALRELTLQLLDDLFQRTKNKTVRELLNLEKQADWLAEQAVALILPVLRQDMILDFLAGEIQALV